MAQLVGDAYIRIFGDTSAMRRALKREEKLLASDAEDAADSFLFNFSETIEKRAQSRMRGTQVAIADAIVGKDFDRLLKQSGRSVDDFTRDMNQTLTEFFEKGHFRKGAIGVLDFRQSLATLDEWAKETKVIQQIRDVEAASRNLARARQEQDRAWVTYGKNLLATEKLMNSNRTLLHRYGRDIDMVTVRLDKHSNALGRAFGEGSRSEVLNFVGRTIGNLSRIPAAFLKMGGSVVSFLDEVRALNSEGTGMLRAFGTVAMRSLGGVIASIASMLIGMAAMSQIIPAVLSLLALLAGSIIAVAGAIGQGLMGALLPLGPIVLGLIGGIGALTLGLSGLGDASDRAKKKIKPLSDAWAKFRKDFTEGFVNDIQPAISGFVGIIEDTLTPLMDNMSNVIGWLARRLSDLFNSKQMKPFLDAMETSLPHIFQSLGSGLIELGAALTAFFKPILPFAERLAQKFEDAMTTFREWATSAGGQNSIRDFMEKAWEAGSKLWTIITNIGSIIWSVFGAGAEGPGKSFLTWLSEVTTKWAEFLNSKEGQEALKTFFEDVAGFMSEVRDILSILNEKLKEIDWEQAISDVMTFLGMVQSALQFFGAIWTGVADAVATGRQTITEEIENLKGIYGSLEEFGATVNELLTRGFRWAHDWLFVTIPTMIAQVIAWFASWSPGIGAAISTVWTVITTPFRLAWQFLTTTVPTWAGIIGGWIGRIGPTVGAMLAGLFNIATAPFRAVWGWIVGEVVQWSVRIGGFVRAIPTSVSAALTTLSAAFTAPFRAAYEAVAGWVQRIKDLVAGAIAWVANNAPKLPDWMVPGISGPPRGGAGGAASFGPGTTSAPAGMRGADNPLANLPSLTSLSSLTRSLQKPEQQQQAQRVVNIYPGAIVVQSPSSDPEQVAGAVVDRLAARLVSV